MKAAIVGSSGYIGGYLYRRLSADPGIEEVLCIDQGDDADIVLDLVRTNEFSFDALKNVRYIILTAGVSSPDQCAKEFERCWQINVTGTGTFIAQALRRGCRVLFFSSDAVFGDIPGAVYDENAPTEAKTPYGRMKKAIEDRFAAEPGFKAIRLAYVASARDRFISYCLSCLEKGATAEVFHPLYRNCVTVTDVVDTVQWFIHHWQEYEPTFLNVAGAELVSRVRIADEICRLTDGCLQYTIQYPGDAFYTNRPKITQMKSLYLQKYGILPQESFTEKIQKELRGYLK